MGQLFTILTILSRKFFIPMTLNSTKNAILKSRLTVLISSLFQKVLEIISFILDAISARNIKTVMTLKSFFNI